MCASSAFGILTALANHLTAPTLGTSMNVTITENPRLADIEVTLACPRIDERVQRIVAG